MAQLKRTAGRSIMQAAVSKITGRTAPAGSPTAATPGNKVGMTAIGDRSVATAQAPSAKTGAGENRSQFWTYFTTAAGDSYRLYSGDRLWARVTLTLETAGPVAVGQSANLKPLLSGTGVLLETGTPTPFTIAKGSSLYIASSAVNRVKVSVEPLPWLEQITALLNSIAVKLIG